MSSVIKVNSIQDSGGNAIITSDGSGNITTQNVAANTPAFHVYLSSNQTVTTATYTKANLDTERWDTNNAFASNKFTVPSGEGGKYQFNFRVKFGSMDSSEDVRGVLYVNGSVNYNTECKDFSAATGDQVTSMASVILNLSASDYVELYVRHNRGSDNALFGGTSDASWLEGYKLIGV